MKKPIQLVLLFCLLQQQSMANDTLVYFAQSTTQPGSSWKYLDNGSDQGTAWRNAGFNDAAWASGNSELGYGDGDENTIVGFGPDANNKYATTYFRKVINITNPAAYLRFKLDTKRDDGIVVYVNGIEVFRDNIPTNPAYNDYTGSAVSDDGDGILTTNLTNGLPFVAGNNTIAVEIHQANGSSSDLTFDLQLIGVTTTALIARGPYLQMGNETAITLRWQTDVANDSKVMWGTTAGSLTNSLTDGALTTNHELRITGLTADTKYFYSVGTTTEVLQTGATNYFTTVPPANTTRKVRIAAFGDCGNGSTNQTNVKNQYLNYAGSNIADAWILLGDNAYSSGTETEYQNYFFDMYKNDLLKNHKLYPAPGNHDYGNTQANSGVRNNTYYNSFNLPTAGECGGVASGTEAFYSFDIGNVHCISLDSYGREDGNTTRLYDTTGAQVVWLKNDLAANTRKWVVVYFHHPPYTMGSHNSDTEGELISLRTNLIRIFERYGVDLVLCGHSHNYERSYLLNKHYGSRASFDLATHAISSSNAQYDGSTNSCPYTYVGGQVEHGTVYVVAGSAGQSGGIQGGGLYPHSALPFAYTDNSIGGSLLLEFDDNRMDAKMIGADGIIKDQFTMLKDVKKKNTINILSGNNTTLNASWPGTYSWTTSATTRSISVSPSSNTTYYVSDNAGCLQDTFDVRLITLPVTITTISANTQKNIVTLQWQTNNETGIAQYVIERSDDGNTYQAIGQLRSKGDHAQGHTYQWQDASITKNGIYQYRLRIRQRDGNQLFSRVVSAAFNSNALLLLNSKVVNLGSPIQGRVMNNQQCTIRLFAADGKLVGSTVCSSNFSLSTANLTAGRYLLKATMSNQQSSTQTIILQ
jgi:acid phosphatase type 7